MEIDILEKVGTVDGKPENSTVSFTIRTPQNMNSTEVKLW